MHTCLYTLIIRDILTEQLKKLKILFSCYPEKRKLMLNHRHLNIMLKVYVEMTMGEQGFYFSLINFLELIIDKSLVVKKSATR